MDLSTLLIDGGIALTTLLAVDTFVLDPRRKARKEKRARERDDSTGLYGQRNTIHTAEESYNLGVSYTTGDGDRLTGQMLHDWITSACTQHGVGHDHKNCADPVCRKASEPVAEKPSGKNPEKASGEKSGIVFPENFGSNLRKALAGNWDDLILENPATPLPEKPGGRSPEIDVGALVAESERQFREITAAKTATSFVGQTPEQIRWKHLRGGPAYLTYSVLWDVPRDRIRVIYGEVLAKMSAGDLPQMPGGSSADDVFKAIVRRDYDVEGQARRPGRRCNELSGHEAHTWTGTHTRMRCPGASNPILPCPQTGLHHEHTWSQIFSGDGAFGGGGVRDCERTCPGVFDLGPEVPGAAVARREGRREVTDESHPCCLACEHPWALHGSAAGCAAPVRTGAPLAGLEVPCGCSAVGSRRLTAQLAVVQTQLAALTRQVATLNDLLTDLRRR